LKSGGLYVEADFGTPLRELFSFWHGKKSVKTEREAERLAERFGIFTPKSPGQVRFKLVATTLYDAFWLMLAFDHSVRRATLTRCADPFCQKEFVLDRANKRYHSPECAQRVASRNYETRKRIATRKNRSDQKAVPRKH
jgi:hypothetical protein